MTVILDIEPDIQAAARAAAKERSISLEDFLQTVVASGLIPKHVTTLPQEQWETLLRGSTFRSARPLSDEDLSRENLYED